MILKEILKANLKVLEENEATSLTMGCLLDNNCNLECCRTNDYNPYEKDPSKKGLCCGDYEQKCRATIEALKAST